VRFMVLVHLMQGRVLPQKKSDVPTFTSIFGKTMVDIAKKNNKVLAVTAAMKEGTGLQVFAEKFPDRFLTLVLQNNMLCLFVQA